MVRRAAATSRLFMQRILSQFAAVGGGDDGDEAEWEEASDEDEALPRRRRRGGSGSRAACSSGPQVPAASVTATHAYGSSTCAHAPSHRTQLQQHPALFEYCCTTC